MSGPYLANLLSQKLGYGVSANEPYYTPGCASARSAYFPNAHHSAAGVVGAGQASACSTFPRPTSAIPLFPRGAFGKILRDDKGSFRIDGNTERWGLLSAYYYFDDYNLNNPYPTGQGGASVPGFAALNLGRSQLINLGDTKTFGPTVVNELRLSFMRNANNVGQPSGGVGPSLASQGFVTGTGNVRALSCWRRKIEGIENVFFNSFVMGTPITNLTQANNTYALSDNFSKVFGAHNFKVGFPGSYEQVNVNPNPQFNGSFLFHGSETGSDFADFLIGVASNYNQADSQTLLWTAQVRRGVSRRIAGA